MHMILYSINIKISNDIKKDWVKWMKEVHIPDVMRTDQFIDWQLQKQLLPEDTIGESTYVINYLAQSFEHYQMYAENEAPRLQKEYKEKFPGKYIATRAVYSLLSK